MRIAYLSFSPLRAGVANAVHVMSMCSAFAAAGHETTLFARGSGRRDRAAEIFSMYGVPGGFELRLRRAARVKLLGRLCYALRQALHARLAVNAHVYYARCLVSAMCVLLLGGAVVLELHELPHSELERRMQRFALRHPRFRRLVVISQALLDDLARVHRGALDGIDAVVAPDGASERSPCAAFPLERGRGRQIGYAGGLRAGNGIGILLALAEAFPDDTFHVLGGSGGEIANWLSIRKTANVVWYGRAEPAAVPGFLAACDVLLAPYENGAKTHSGNDTSRWMSPLKIFEYMAAGKAMIVSDFPVLREVLDEDVAMLAEPSNLAAWKDALARLRDESLRKRLGDAAREALESRYTWAARARAVLECLEEAQARQPREPGAEAPTVSSASDPV